MSLYVFVACSCSLLNMGPRCGAVLVTNVYCVGCTTDSVASQWWRHWEGKLWWHWEGERESGGSTERESCGGTGRESGGGTSTSLCLPLPTEKCALASYVFPGLAVS